MGTFTNFPTGIKTFIGGTNIEEKTSNYTVVVNTD